MKRIVLFGVSLSLAFAVSAQQIKQNMPSVSKPVKAKIELPANTASVPIQKPGKPHYNRAITITSLGTSANAYGFYNGARTNIWANNDLNTITFVHRSQTPSGSHLSVDFSKDGGNTWFINKGPIYSPPANARYPMGAIYNPSGNTNPNNAYVAYFAPTLDGSNSNWGGYGYGEYKLDTLTAPTQGSFTSTGAYKLAVPDAYWMTQNGKVFVVDPAYTGAVSTGYTDTLVITKGVWNGTTNKFDYTQQLLYFKTTDAANLSDNEKAAPVDTRIAFAPNGQTGYISMLTHNDLTANPDEGYYPVLLKTTDGGATWSSPIKVILNKINEIKYFISDQLLSQYFTTVPDRDSIWYRTAFDHGLAVDANGNPHICVAVSIMASTAFSIASAPGYFGVFHIWSPDGGTNWNAKLLSLPGAFRADNLGGISEDLRPCVATNWAGNKVFFSWLETDTVLFPGVKNNNPDIRVTGYNITNGYRTSVVNVTAGSLADGECFMGSLSRYVLGNTGTYKLPIIYQAMDVSNAGNPVTYKYIGGMEFTDSQFTDGTGIDPVVASNLEVSGNYPNPFNNSTMVNVNLPSASDLTITISNILGQTVSARNYGKLASGAHQLVIDGSNLNSGVYFYTVNACGKTITRKMIVE